MYEYVIEELEARLEEMKDTLEHSYDVKKLAAQRYEKCVTSIYEQEKQMQQTKEVLEKLKGEKS